MTFLQNIQTWVKSHSIQGTKATWGLFLLFAGIIFIKVVLFHWFIFHSLLISSLWETPFEFWSFWLPKILTAIFIASFLFITKTKGWIIVTSILIDCWCIANLIYYGANGLFIDLTAMFLINNLTGFWSSLSTFFSWQYVLIPFITILLVCALPLFKSPKKNTRIWLLCLVTCIIYQIVNCAPKWKSCYYEQLAEHNFAVLNGTDGYDSGWLGLKLFLPFHDAKLSALGITYVPFDSWSKDYIRTENILQYIPAMCIYTLFDTYQGNENIDLTKLEKCIQSTDSAKIQSKDNLIIILVESFESWAISSKICGQNVMPNLQQFIAENPILYCDSIKSQVRNGVSGDGQMIVNTGLLPIQRGAACTSYKNNVYPNFVHAFSHSMTIAPSNGWSQDTMSVRYGYDQTLYIHHLCPKPVSGRSVEAMSFSQLTNVLDTIQQPFAIQLLTVASHSPFDDFSSTGTFPEDMPLYMRDYLMCLNYTDSCMVPFFETFTKNPKLRNTTIVITGDHTAFKNDFVATFLPFATKYNLPIKTNESYCPLIIYSPQLQDNIHINELCYQMDIYPTIMHLIGCEDYYWKGLGVNLLDSIARHNRLITEKEAYNLSDKMIRMDYFKDLQ